MGCLIWASWGSSGVLAQPQCCSGGFLGVFLQLGCAGEEGEERAGGSCSVAGTGSMVSGWALAPHREDGAGSSHISALDSP